MKPTVKPRLIRLRLTPKITALYPRAVKVTDIYRVLKIPDPQRHKRS